jgi:subtilisin family serine protease
VNLLAAAGLLIFSMAASGPLNRTPVEPAEVLVVEPSENFLQEVAQLDITVIERVRLDAIGTDVYRIQPPEGVSVEETIVVLREHFPGAGIDVNHAFMPSAATPGGSGELSSWTRSVSGWSPVAADCGRGVRIGMIDASVDVGHPALAGQRIEFRSFHNPERRPAAAVHGTAVAAMLIGRSSDQGWGGILPGAELRAANIFEYNESGHLVGNAVALLKAFDWMVAEGVHVVNMSVAGLDSEALRSVIEGAQKKGLVTVAAAGNWGSADRPAYPAAYDQVIAVTAFGPDGERYNMANRGSYIDFAAPGVEIWTAVPDGGRVQSGTSFAVPYVSAQIAVEVAGGAASRPEVMRELLKKRAVDMGSPGKDDDYGWGFVAEEPSCSQRISADQNS